MRLDKYIATTTDFSRKEVKHAIKQHLVEVDGKIATNPAHHVAEDASVTINGAHLKAPAARYFMLNKPDGVVSATKDGTNPTVIDLLVDEPNSDKLHIAGRLDIDTTGLVLITDDGQWTHRVISPNQQCKKRYYVELQAEIDAKTLKHFERGILLSGEKKRCKPAHIEILHPDSCLLTIHEGKFHQIKRMFAAMGNEVTYLHREAIGAIELDEALEFGEYRPLTESEIQSI